MLGIRHISLIVRDLDLSIAFYEGILGMRIIWQPDGTSAYLSSGSDILALHVSDTPPAPNYVGESRLDHFGFLVSKASDVDEWGVRLESLAITLVQGAKTHRDGSRSIYFRDPDGNLIQLLFHPHLG